MPRLSPQQVILALISSGRTQQDIASAVGVSQATISRILSGEHKDPKSSVVDKLRALTTKS